jgi:hypothetical protein
MFRSTIVRVCLSASFWGDVLGMAACSSEPTTPPAEVKSGTFSMPLVASSGAHTYRLDGYLYLQGPEYRYLDFNGDTDFVTTSLATGNYTAQLWSWSLSRDDGSGYFAPVEATLVSDWGPSFSIFNQTTTTLSFEFETDGQLVTVGSGSLRVAVEVNETAPVCAPLGDDCAPGTWCPPSELTGAILGCIPEGPVSVGEPCSAPTDCSGNASCFDFGLGPVCAQLCGVEGVGPSCGEGSCTPQGVDYGVCTPL